MTKKISCRIIDSVPLSCDNPDLHLGWCLDAKIYPHNGLPTTTYNTRFSTGNPQTNLDATGNLLDFYA